MGEIFIHLVLLSLAAASSVDSYRGLHLQTKPSKETLLESHKAFDKSSFEDLCPTFDAFKQSYFTCYFVAWSSPPLFNEWRQRKCALKGKTQNEQSKPNQTEQSMSSLSVSNDFSVPTEPFSRRHVTLFCPRLSSDDVPLQAVEATGSSGLQIV